VLAAKTASEQVVLSVRQTCAGCGFIRQWIVIRRSSSICGQKVSCFWLELAAQGGKYIFETAMKFDANV